MAKSHQISNEIWWKDSVEQKETSCLGIKCRIAKMEVYYSSSHLVSWGATQRSEMGILIEFQSVFCRTFFITFEIICSHFKFRGSFWPFFKKYDLSTWAFSQIERVIIKLPSKQVLDYLLKYTWSIFPVAFWQTLETFFSTRTNNLKSSIFQMRCKT